MGIRQGPPCICEAETTHGCWTRIVGRYGARTTLVQRWGSKAMVDWDHPWVQN